VSRLHAPSVTFPVGRSAFQGLLLLATWAAGALACATLALQVGGWRGWLALALSGAAGLTAAAWWRGQRPGVLHWDGAAWEWVAQVGAPPERGKLLAALDLQRALLLRWRGDQRSAWLWAERASAPHRWAALRRAVYSPAGSDAPAGAEPPAAAP